MTGPRAVAWAAAVTGLVSTILAGMVTYLFTAVFESLRTIDGGGGAGLVIGMAASTGLFGLLLGGIVTAFVEHQDLRRGLGISLAIMLGVFACCLGAGWLLVSR